LHYGSGGAAKRESRRITRHLARWRFTRAECPRCSLRRREPPNSLPKRQRWRPVPSGAASKCGCTTITANLGTGRPSTRARRFRGRRPDRADRRWPDENGRCGWGPERRWHVAIGELPPLDEQDNVLFGRHERRERSMAHLRASSARETLRSPGDGVVSSLLRGIAALDPGYASSTSGGH